MSSVVAIRDKTPMCNNGSIDTECLYKQNQIKLDFNWKIPI